MISQDLNPVLNWLKTCPFKYNISTLQTGHLHVKIEVPTNNENQLGDKNANSRFFKSQD